MLRKTTDLVFVIPAGTVVWNTTQHEPLILAIALPLRTEHPWKIRGTDIAERLERKMREM
jgi:hypothetical protein